MAKPIEIQRKYFERYYDINENIYEITSISLERN